MRRSSPRLLAALLLAAVPAAACAPPAASAPSAATPPAASQPAASPPAAARAAAAPAADERAVLAVVERLFDGMRARDTAAMRATFAPGASLATTLVRDGQPTVQRDSIGAFLASIARAPAGLLLDERLYNPQVRISDGLAAVWVEYDLYVGERFSHCGIDAFHLARVGGDWRIVHLIDTRQREGCPAR